MAIGIYEKSTGRRLFEVTPAQHTQLRGALEEDDVGDHDYYIDSAVCDYLEGRVDEEVIARLREALGPAGAKAALPSDVEAAGDDEPPPEMDAEESGIEIEWREE